MSTVGSDVDLNEYSEFDSDAVDSDISEDGQDNPSRVDHDESVAIENIVTNEPKIEQIGHCEGDGIKGKSDEYTDAGARKKRLQLLGLPADVLKLILGEV